MRFTLWCSILLICVVFAGGCSTAETGSKQVKLETTMGNVVIELNEQDAPITAGNFLRYVTEGFYNGTIFHRVIPNFMIQGGGFTPNLSDKPTYPPIPNEAGNGLRNDRGTIAMARTANPDSATSQFFINLVSNDSLNYASPAKPGYAVFGRVIQGMEVVDKIAGVKTTTKMGTIHGRRTQLQNVPVEPVVIKSAQLVTVK